MSSKESKPRAKKPTPAQLQAMVVIVREEWHLGGATDYASVHDKRDRWQDGIRRWQDGIRKQTAKSLSQSPWFSDVTIEQEAGEKRIRRWEINAAGVALVMAELHKSGRTETTPEEYRAAILAERDARRKLVQAEQDRKATSRKIIERSSPSFVSFSADRKNYTIFTLEMECLPNVMIYVTEYFNSDLDASDVKIEMSRCEFDVDDYQWFQVLMSRAVELAADRIAKLYADTQEPPVQGGGGGAVPETPAPQLLLPARAESLIPRYERCSNVGRDTPRSRWESHAVGASKPRQESKVSVAGAVKLTKPQRKALELLAERAGHGVWSRIDISFVVLDRLSTMGFAKEITSEGHDRTDRNVDVLYCITPAGRAALGNTPPAPAVKDDPTVQAAHALLDEVSEPLDLPALDHHDTRDIAAMEAVDAPNPLRYSDYDQFDTDDRAEPVIGIVRNPLDQLVAGMSTDNAAAMIWWERRGYECCADSGAGVMLNEFDAEELEFVASGDDNERYPVLKGDWTHSAARAAFCIGWQRRLVARPEPPAPVTAPDALTAEERLNVEDLRRVTNRFTASFAEHDLKTLIAIIDRLAPKGGAA